MPPPLARVLAGRPLVIDGQRLDPEMQLGLRVISQGDGPRTPVDARVELARSVRRVSLPLPIGGVEALRAGGLPARLYRPSAPTGGLLVFFHGGGFVVGDLDTHDAPCRFLAERAGVPSCSRRLPAGARAPVPGRGRRRAGGVRWARDHAAELGADPARIAVGGDSAGGKLAAVAGAAAREAAAAGLPAADLSRRRLGRGQRRSRDLFAEGFFLTSERWTWFYREHYLARRRGPRSTRARRRCCADDLAGSRPLAS